MKMTIYNFLASFLWSNLFLIFFFIVRRRYSFLRNNGVLPLLFLLLISFLRFFATLEFPYTKMVEVKGFLSFLQLALRNNSLLFKLPYGTILLAVWGSGTLFLLFQLVIRLLLQKRIVDRMPCLSNHEVLYAINLQPKRFKSLTIIVTPDIDRPCVTGFCNPRILLPDVKLSTEDWSCILRHEISHIANGDLWLKLLVDIYKAVFWWNPLVYYLEKDFDYILELRTDVNATEGLTEKEKMDYVQAIINVLKTIEGDRKLHHYTLLLGDCNNKDKIIERVKLILDRPHKYHKPICLYAVLAALLILSYAFVIQPAGYPPEEEICGTLDINFENAFLVHKDNQYHLYINGEYAWTLSELESIFQQPYSGLIVQEGD